LLITGFGSIARRLVELVAPLGLKVLAYRRRPRGDEGVPMVSLSSLNEALAAADHVMNILPLSPQTQHFFNRERFAQLKPGAIFYNIGRGATVDQTALLEVLQSQHLKAAWLDVTDPEPLPEGHPLLAEPRCHITPHVAGGHADEAQALVQHFVNNLQRFIQDKPLLDRVM
jgi:phosphoglycerate dehydrogenase-like enzyme